MTCVLGLVLAGCGGASGPAAPTRTATAVDDAALSALLAARDAAFTGEGGAAVAADDPLLLRAGDVPFTAWSTRVVGATAGDGGTDVRVEVTYRLPGDTVDVVRSRVLTVRPGPDGPRVVADRPDGGPRDLWDLGPVRVVRGDRAVVLAAVEAPAGAAEQLAGDVAAAARTVDAAWGTGWRRDTVVLLPATVAGAAVLTGRTEDDVAQQAAVTVATVDDTPGGRRGGDERVVVTPTAVEVFSDTGRRLVVAHELSHVAARAGARFAVPLWFEEGLAEHVAWTGATGSPPDVYADALAAVTARGVPRRLPGADDFGPGASDPDLPYLLSWYACQVLAGDGGTARLVAVHRIASGRDAPTPGGPPAPDAATAWAAALARAGLDEDGLVTLWRREVARAARITP